MAGGNTWRESNQDVFPVVCPWVGVKESLRCLWEGEFEMGGAKTQAGLYHPTAKPAWLPRTDEANGCKRKSLPLLPSLAPDGSPKYPLNAKPLVSQQRGNAELEGPLTVALSVDLPSHPFFLEGGGSPQLAWATSVPLRL